MSDNQPSTQSNDQRKRRHEIALGMALVVSMGLMPPLELAAMQRRHDRLALIAKKHRENGTVAEPVKEDE
jgi:hypothetical protein